MKGIYVFTFFIRCSARQNASENQPLGSLQVSLSLTKRHSILVLTHLCMFLVCIVFLSLIFTVYIRWYVFIHFSNILVILFPFPEFFFHPIFMDYFHVMKVMKIYEKSLTLIRNLGVIFFSFHFYRNIVNCIVNFLI